MINRSEKYTGVTGVDLEEVDSLIKSLRNNGQMWLYETPEMSLEQAFNKTCKDSQRAMYLLEDAADEIVELRERVEELKEQLEEK